MAEKLNLNIGSEVRELKIGQSFTNSKSTAFHTLKYDFKPASVDKNKIANVDVGNNHQVTVTVPHLDGAGIPKTVFKGSQRPHQKECVLIIDRATGEITLEKLACNIQVKKTRSESTKAPLPQERTNSTTSSNNDKSGGATFSNNPHPRSQTPPIAGQRISNRTKVTSGSRRPDRQITNLPPKHSPLHASPNYPSPNHHNKSPKQDLRHMNNDTHNPSTLASLPMIGLDDFSEPPPPSAAISHHTPPAPAPTITKTSPSLFSIGEISDSSSGSSSSDSESDAEHNATVVEKNLTGTSNRKTNGYSNGMEAGRFSTTPSSMPSHLLNEDLCLSESD